MNTRQQSEQELTPLVSSAGETSTSTDSTMKAKLLPYLARNGGCPSSSMSSQTELNRASAAETKPTTIAMDANGAGGELP
ncbi:unnamed protein product [Cochlearia groenlandica]